MVKEGHVLSSQSTALKEREKNQPLSKKEQFKRVNAWLMQTYPACFRKTKPQPLKHGIRNDILEHYHLDDVVFTIDNLRETLGWYRRRFQYLQAIVAKRPRIDLNGNIVGEVTDEEVEEALEQMKNLLQKDYGRLFN